MDEVIEKATEHLAVGSPRQALLSRKIATESIKKTIKEIDAILRGQIDNLVESLKWTSPEFHLFYINARHVMKHGNRHNGEGDEGAGADNERSTQYDGDDE